MRIAIDGPRRANPTHTVRPQYHPTLCLWACTFSQGVNGLTAAVSQAGHSGYLRCPRLVDCRHRLSSLLDGKCLASREASYPLGFRRISCSSRSGSGWSLPRKDALLVGQQSLGERHAPERSPRSRRARCASGSGSANCDANRLPRHGATLSRASFARPLADFAEVAMVCYERSAGVVVSNRNSSADRRLFGNAVHINPRLDQLIHRLHLLVFEIKVDASINPHRSIAKRIALVYIAMSRHRHWRSAAKTIAGGV